MLQLLFTILFLPIFLVKINYRIAEKYSIKWLFILNAIVICSSIFLSAKLGFLNWADSVGRRDNPDGETLMIVSLEAQGGMFVAIMGVVIAFGKLWRTKNGADYHSS